MRKRSSKVKKRSGRRSAGVAHRRASDAFAGMDAIIVPCRLIDARTSAALLGLQAAKNVAAVELGRLGGRKGGRVRAKKMSPARRSKIAQKAAQARWSKRRKRS